MKFEFYHGTSDLFLKSIQEKGLGGINPNYEYKHLDTLRFLYELAERYLCHDLDFLQMRDTTNAMVKQCKLQITVNGKNEILNFNHDGIYIALSIQRAICYATSTIYGSEIVHTSIRLMELLDKIQIDYSNADLAIESFITMRKMNPKPIIIKIRDIDENNLDKEDGKTAKEALDFLRSIHNSLSEKQRFEFYQFCNFKILEPIPVQKLEFYKLDYLGKFAQPDFNYKLTEIYL